MKKDKIIELLHTLGAHQTWDDGDWVTTHCLFAPWTHKKGKDSNPSFGIKIVDDGTSYYNCWACGGGHDLDRMLGKLIMLGARKPKYDIAAAQDILIKQQVAPMAAKIKQYTELKNQALIDVEFTPDWLNTFMPAWNVPLARDYLQSRHVGAEQAAFFDIRWDTSKQTVAFPIYDQNKKCLGLHGRFLKPWVSHTGATIRYYSYGFGPNDHRNKHVWLGEWYVREDIPVVMCEGMFDVASVWRIYPNVVTPLITGMNADKLRRIKWRVGQIITLFDIGQAGDKAREIIQSEFGLQTIAHLVPPTDRDPGDMTTQELKNLLDPVLG